MQGESSAAALLPNAMRKYASNAVEDNVSMWLLWVPCDAIIYAIPLWMRLPANHAISFRRMSPSSGGGDEARLLRCQGGGAQEAMETPRRRGAPGCSRRLPREVPYLIPICYPSSKCTTPPFRAAALCGATCRPGLPCCVRRLPTTSWTMSSALS